MGKGQNKRTKPRKKVEPRELNLNEDVDRLLATRRIFIFHELDEPMASKVTEQALLLADDNPKREIEVYINSFGGSAYSAMALNDLFRMVKPDIRTIVLGSAASAAAFVAAAGTKGKRCAGRNSTFMYHQLSWEVDAKVKDMSVKTADPSRRSMATPSPGGISIPAKSFRIWLAISEPRVAETVLRRIPRDRPSSGRSCQQSRQGPRPPRQTLKTAVFPGMPTWSRLPDSLAPFPAIARYFSNALAKTENRGSCSK